MAKIYVVMGKSSTGKDTIFKMLTADNELNLKPIIIYTTRPIRNGEVDGREYHFTNESGLREYENKGKLIELRKYNTVYGVWNYFTVDDGQTDIESDNRYMIISTLEAYMQYVKYFGKEMVVPVYIEVDNRTRIHRAIEREDNEINPKYTELCRRFVADEEDFSEEKLKESGIDKRYINNVLEDCFFEIKEAIMKDIRDK